MDDKKISTDDHSIISKLTKKHSNKQNKSKKPKLKTLSSTKIIHSLKIISPKILNFKTQSYYKIPFTQYNNDNSYICKELIREIKNGLIKAFKNYLDDKLYFYLVFEDKEVLFEEFIKVPLSFKYILESNEINFANNSDKNSSKASSGAIKNEYLLIKDILDQKLFIDFIVNFKYSPSSKLPFIISKYQFENSIFYNTEFKHLNTIKDKGDIKYCYEIRGYLICDDFREFEEMGCEILFY